MNSVHATQFGVEETTTATVTQARENISDLLDATEHHGQTIVITRSGTPAGKLCPPDAGRMPDPDLWQKAQEAYDRAVGSDWYRKLPLTAQSALAALAALPRAYYGYDQGSAARTCTRCGTEISATRSDTNWVDRDGWDKCQSTAFNHEPAAKAATSTAQEKP